MEEKIKKIADKFGEVYEEVEAVAKKLGCFSEKMLYGTNKPRAEFAVETLEYLLEFYTAPKLLKLFGAKDYEIDESALKALAATNREGIPFNAAALVNASRKYSKIGDLLYNFGLVANCSIYKHNGGSLEKMFEDFDTAISDHHVDNYYAYSIAFQEPQLMQHVFILTHNLAKNHMQIPTAMLRSLIAAGALEEFAENAVFKFFKKEMSKKRYRKTFVNGKAQKELYNIYDELKSLEPSQYGRILNFARALGCFSFQHMHDKNGKETSEILAQKASVVFAWLYEKEALPFFSHDFCRTLSHDSKQSEKLLAFIAVEDEKGQAQNARILNNLEQTYFGITTKTIENFDKIAAFRHQATAENPTLTLPWHEAIEQHYRNSQGFVNMSNVEKKHMPLAILFNEHNLKMKEFEDSAKLLEMADEFGVREHILGHELKEEAGNEYTFEMLNKRDPKNFLIGLYTSCCASIVSPAYGSTIVKQTITNPRVQNMVVRRADGEIVAKGALYVNEKERFAVFNDFELNEQYKRFEVDDDCGYYRTDTPAGKELENERNAIFAAFMRGVHAFAAEFERTTGQKLLRVHVGGGYNRLKAQCAACGQAEKALEIPKELGFQDAEAKQFVLYDVEKRQDLSKVVEKKDFEEEMSK